ncbi:hypothetical protein [Bacillus bombysepticus]|uniref:hypothetical protein n=1 Tax=Bacillus bombysepticus TaxID=658666 RepID=UPI003015E8B7
MTHLLEVVKLKVEKAGLAEGASSHELDARIKEGIKLGIKEEATRFPESDIYPEDVDSILDDIAQNVVDGYVNIDSLTITLYDRESYMATYVTNDVEGSGLSIIDGLYNFMNADDRGLWLEKFYVSIEEHHYSDDRTSIVIVTNED